MAPDPAQLTPTLKALRLLLVLFASASLAPAKMSYLRQLQASADEGEPEAQFILGLTYRDGWDGTVRAGSLTARWCELADEVGDQRPGLVLSLLRQEKAPVRKDAIRAITWLNAAAEHGDDYARVILGEMLLEGNGVPADWRRGAEWITKAARAGFAPAQFRLGVLYLVGDAALPRNEIEALAWFIVAADAGSKSAAEYRDERTSLLGRDTARLAVLRSRALRAKVE